MRSAAFVIVRRVTWVSAALVATALAACDADEESGGNGADADAAGEDGTGGDLGVTDLGPDSDADDDATAPDAGETGDDMEMGAPDAGDAVPDAVNDGDAEADVQADVPTDPGADAIPDGPRDARADSPDAPDAPDAPVGDCRAGETRPWTCPEGAEVPWCVCAEGAWLCDADPGALCGARDCNDGTEPLCDRMTPVCNEWEVLVVRDSCEVCVNPATCRPWGEAECATGDDCAAGETCDLCGSSSCPSCDDCLGACEPACPTEALVECGAVRPDCADGQVTVIRDGCWLCVDSETCAEPEADSCGPAGGYCAHFAATCAPLYHGTGPLDCPGGRSDQCCLPDVPHPCDDGTEVMCLRPTPGCNPWEVIAVRNYCYECVNPWTCQAWGISGCDGDGQCDASEACDGCATSSCPDCDDCVSACVPHGCATEERLTCRCARPDCVAGEVSVIRDGCWVCVDEASCETTTAECVSGS